MILGLQTSDPICHVWLDGNQYTFDAGRTLAHNILSFIEECLKKEQVDITGLTGLVVFRGPGSFTGLRIGITVMNTIAASEQLPIVGETGNDWLAKGTARLHAGSNDQIVLPEYGSDAHITLPKK